MKRFPHLPPQQWSTQNLLDEFNGDEARWKERLLRRLRRKLNPKIAEDLWSILERLRSIERCNS